MDAAYLRLAAGKVTESEEVRPGLIVDFGANEKVLGVEILRFSRRFQPKFRPRRSGSRHANPRGSGTAAVIRSIRRHFKLADGDGVEVRSRGEANPPHADEDIE